MPPSSLAHAHQQAQLVNGVHPPPVHVDIPTSGDMLDKHPMTPTAGVSSLKLSRSWSEPALISSPPCRRKMTMPAAAERAEAGEAAAAVQWRLRRRLHVLHQRQHAVGGGEEATAGEVGVVVPLWR